MKDARCFLCNIPMRVHDKAMGKESCTKCREFRLLVYAQLRNLSGLTKKATDKYINSSRGKKIRRDWQINNLSKASKASLDCYFKKLYGSSEAAQALRQLNKEIKNGKKKACG